MSQTENFPWTDEHHVLRQTVRRLLSQKSPMPRIRELADSEQGYDPKLWAELGEMGLVGLFLPESMGDVELNYLSLAIVLEEMGRSLCPSPFLGSVLAGVAIERGGTEEQQKLLLPDIVAGKTIATLALTEPEASWEPDAVTSRAEPSGDDFVLHGVKTHVLWGSQANQVVAPFRTGDSQQLFVIDLPASGVTVEPEVPIDPTRRTARLTFDGVKVTADRRLGEDGTLALRQTHMIGYALVAAELLGGAEATLAMTRAYAIERHQFDRAIGSFQAVKHPIVNVMIALEQARSLVMGTIDALDRDLSAAAIPARMAKAAATDAFLFACDRGVQTHGGFGFTWDCDVHFYFKRALWGAATLGDARHHRRHLGETLRSTAHSG